jgi:hypothetical protein
MSYLKPHNPLSFQNFQKSSVHPQENGKIHLSGKFHVNRLNHSRHIFSQAQSIAKQHVATLTAWLPIAVLVSKNIFF